MTMEQPGHDESKPASEPMRQPAAAVVANPSRRRFNRAGVGASAVVLTLASRSVLADTVCKSPSGFASIEPSMHAKDKSNSCRGVGPRGWLSRRDWGIQKDTPFLTIFGIARDDLYAELPSTTTENGQTVVKNGILLKEATMLQALNGKDTLVIVKNLIAAWLNASNGLNTFPNTNQVVQIYSEWHRNGTYEANATVIWDVAKINTYLQSTGSTD